MNPKLKNSLNLILGLILIGLVSWATVWVVIHLASWFANLNDTVKTAILAAVPILTVAIIGHLANKSLEMKKSIEQALRPKKLELYDEFIEFLMRIFGNEKVVEKPSEADIMQFFADKTPKLITFASNRVIKKWGKLRIGLSEGSDKERMFLMEDVMKEIRTDIGHEKRNFRKGDILRLFINDIDDYLK